MKRKEHLHLLELIVNSSAKQQGNFSKTAELVCQSLRDLCGVSQVSVWLFETETKANKLPSLCAPTSHYRFCASACDNQELFDSFVDMRESAVFANNYINQLRQHCYLQSNQAQQDSLLSPLQSYYISTKVISVLDVAIRINGHIEGVLSLESCHDLKWQQQDIQLITQYADQLALTLATRYSYDKAERIDLLISAVEQSEHVVMLVNLDTHIIEYVNIAHQKMTGLPRDSVQNHHVKVLDIFRNKPEFVDVVTSKLFRGEVLTGDTKLARVDGTQYYLNYHISPFVTEQGNTFALVSSYDNSAEYEYRQELEKLAWHCSLTGLHNRSYFKPVLDEAKSGYLIIIDILGFKRYNDTHGHEMGDALLIEIARRLKHFAKTNDAIDLARIGSDEFAMILPEVCLPKQTDQLMQKLYDKLGAPSIIVRQKIEPKVAMAVVELRSLVDNRYAPLSCADIALQYAKKNVSTHLQYFNKDLLNTFENNAAIERDLKKAITGGQFELYYQPLKDLQNERYIGAEALIRWNHPKKGVLYPGVFIGVAEQTGLINAIGEWVLEAACKQLNLWQHKDVDVSMHVNVAARQFFSGNLFEQVWTMLTRYRIKPQSLILEITETELMGDVRYATMLCHELAELGVGLAIDDFGTGYSSMRYLKQFPITKLKIDRSFIMDISSSRESREIVSAIIAMAKALNISLTAEGVETLEQEKFLTDQFCHHAQGFLYSPALRVNDFSIFIDKKSISKPVEECC